MAEDRTEREIRRLLEAAGAVQAERGKHLKWTLPDGRAFVMSFSPSDRRSSLNSLRDLRRLLGITGQKETRQWSPKTPRTGPRSAVQEEDISAYGPMGLTASLPSLRSQLEGVRCWPVHTPERTRLSAHAWARFQDRMPEAERRESAHKIARALRRWGLTVPNTLMEEANKWQG